ncbi:MAG: single-stranded-DNA-specific exonuclease RecJ [Deltaproteobacteria bacterium]|nr:single-stranded-DNA-specific exonuclease RecJ [Deltaproteobacteria bacterium]
MSSAEQWKVLPPEPDHITGPLVSQEGLHPLVASILARRGVRDAGSARRFLAPRLTDLPDPFDMLGMDQAVRRIARALEHDELIVVSGDYDVDGITSTAIVTMFLQSAGGRVKFFIPNRFQHGYGLTGETVRALLEFQAGLVITVDNGITALEEIPLLHRAGTDTIITDHHLPRPEGVPAGIVLNPLQPGCGYPCKLISGCGVAFKLLTALRKHLRDQNWWSTHRPEPNLRDYLDLVAIGTVADMVPLVEENRVLVSHGLGVLNLEGGTSRRRPGVEALLELANGERRNDNGPTEINARTIAFQVAPRLNAAGRMTEGSLGVELLLAPGLEEARPLAGKLEQENVNRRAVGDSMYKAAVALVEEQGLGDSPGLVVASGEFHEGVSGIVASRLVERYHRPVVVCAEKDGSYKGSARTVPGINITEAISVSAGIMEEWGGHQGAAGCRFSRDMLERFRGEFQQACRNLSEKAAPPALKMEGRLDIGDLSSDLVEQLFRLAPFGEANEEPTFLLEAGQLNQPPTVLAEKHLKWLLAPQVEMVAWQKANGFAPHGVGGYRVRLGFNDFRGVRKIQLTVKDILSG